ncbi:hypothetical protein ACP70R_049738 [Stipagrostis hirtigluma subsp. patula]
MAMKTGEAEPASMSTTAANGPAVSNAKLIVATGHGDCQKLKDLVNKEDATTMMVVVASSKKVSEERSSSAIMHPLLAAAACKGNLEELNFLLIREGPHTRPYKMPGQEFLDQLAAYNSDCTIESLAMQQTAVDVEEGPDAASLLKGVTVEGDTALHVVAANGESDKFKSCADLIHDKDEHMLFARNNKGDTPLHCAARAGKSQMVLHLVGLASGNNRGEALLRKENDKNETALQEAIRIGDSHIVELLLEADQELACFPKEGCSPMYLAILLKEYDIAQTLYEMSKDHVLSYSGPNGQNALHVAVLRGPGYTELALKGGKHLTTQRDENGSTPLHFAAGLQQGQRWPGSVWSQVLEANSAALYQPDNNGLFPIHVAASVGARYTIAMFLKMYPSCAGLRDAKGRTFLHVAVEKKQVQTVQYACRNRSLVWILNMQDNDGNTALHLAVEAGSFRMFRALFGDQKVHLNLTNAKGQTPLDIAQYKVPPGLLYGQDSEVLIRSALVIARATSGACRRDHFEENHEDFHRMKLDYEIKELEKLKDSTQSRSIVTVLIATVTFGASFALPGGYRGDDRTNGGTPTLVGRYSFDAFMAANTLAFICSSIATIGFVYSGSSGVNLRRRRVYLHTSVYFMHTSITALTASFALGVYSVLAPVARKTAIAICVVSPLVVLSNNVEVWGKWVLLASAFRVRRGRCWASLYITTLIVTNLLLGNWPLIVSFWWAAYARKNSIPKMSG